MALGPRYCISSATEHRLERGSMHSTPERPRTSLWSPWLTSWPASPGPCSPAATSTDPSQPNRVERRLRLGTLRAPTFPHHHDGFKFLHRSLQEKQRRKNSHNGVSATRCYEWSSTTDRVLREDTRATHHGQENYSPPKGRIHLRRLVFSTNFSLAVLRRTIHS